MMKVLFIVPYPFDTAPSQRLKFEQYFEYLRENGVEITLSPFVSLSFRKILYKQGHILEKVLFTFFGYLKRIRDILRANNFDIIYLHLEAAPFGPPVFEHLFSMMKKPIVYDIDDIVYLPHASKANKLIKLFKSPGKVPSIMKLSSQIIVVTQYLKEFASQFNENVIYIPPTINTDKYFVKNKSSGQNDVCIGWTGSHSTTEYLLLLKDVLKKIKQRYNVRIRVIGDKDFKIEGLDIQAKDWSSETEVQDIQEIDIGLYPLPRTEWVMGKGGLKALQYMGMGIPVVCTRIGAVLNFIQDGENGFLADLEEEWIEKISRLIDDVALRKQMGSAARKLVEEKFSVKANAPLYLEILKRAYGKRYGEGRLRP